MPHLVRDFVFVLSARHKRIVVIFFGCEPGGLD
jgi:hypothetical protein